MTKSSPADHCKSPVVIFLFSTRPTRRSDPNLAAIIPIPCTPHSDIRTFGHSHVAPPAVIDFPIASGPTSSPPGFPNKGLELRLHGLLFHTAHFRPASKLSPRSHLARREDKSIFVRPSAATHRLGLRIESGRATTASTHQVSNSRPIDNLSGSNPCSQS